MKIVSKGPTLAELRRKVGTRQTIKFGAGDDAIEIQAELLCAVGCWDLPVIFPRGPITEPDSVWLVSGNAPRIEGEHHEPSVVVLVSFTDTGKCQCAVMVLDYKEDSTRLSFGFQLNQAFAEAARDWFTETLRD